MKQIALLGRGYVGSALLKVLRKRGYEIELLDRTSNFATAIRRCQLLINAAGYAGETNVDDCDRNRGRTLESNVLLPLRLIQLCQRFAKPMLHVSSGCIFNGRKRGRGPWTEKDRPNFTFSDDLHSFYTGTKRMAEEILLGHMTWVCRIRMPFGPVIHPRNLLTKLAGYPVIMEGDNSLTQIDEAAEAMIRLYELNADYGIYHIVNTGPINLFTVHDWLREYHLLSGPRSLKAAQFYSPLLQEPRSHAWLSNEKLLALGIEMSPVADALQAALKVYSS
jgi:dTDP-4-dehydrorhamnose reductase